MRAQLFFFACFLLSDSGRLHFPRRGKGAPIWHVLSPGLCDQGLTRGRCGLGVDACGGQTEAPDQTQVQSGLANPEKLSWTESPVLLTVCPLPHPPLSLVHTPQAVFIHQRRQQMLPRTPCMLGFPLVSGFSSICLVFAATWTCTPAPLYPGREHAESSTVPPSLLLILSALPPLAWENGCPFVFTASK